MSTPLRVNKIRVGAVDVTSGTADPSAGGGVAAPVGSVYARAVTSGVYLKTGTGDTAWQTQAAALFPNVLDYGAAADGVTDDTPAFQAAIAAAVARGGGTVFVPAGEYALDRSGSDTYSVLIDATDNIRILGCGPSTILKMAGDADGGAWSMFRISGASVGIEFEGLSFDQSGITNEGTGNNHFIEATDVEILKIINCNGTGGVAGAGAYIKAGGAAVSIVQISGCDLHDAGGPCVELGGVTTAWVLDSHLVNTGASTPLVVDDTAGDGVSRLIVHSCYVASADGAIEMSTTGTAGSVSVQSCNIEGWLSFGDIDELQVIGNAISLATAALTDPVISIADASYVQVQDNTVRRASTTGAGVLLSLDTVTRSQFIGNHFRQETAAGVILGIDVSSCQFASNHSTATDAGSSARDAYRFEADAVAADNLQFHAETIGAAAGTWLRGLAIAHDGSAIGNVQVSACHMSSVATGVYFDDNSVGSGAFTGRLMVAGSILDASTAAFGIGASGVAIAIGGNASTFGAQILAGNGTPEAAVTARIGSMFLRLDGGTSTTEYIKESGTGNTGWVGK